MEEVARTRQRILRTLDVGRAATADNTDKIYIKIKYRVLYRDDTENISLDVLKSQHQALNACYNQVNDRVTRVPSSGRYNFASVVGNPNIVFLPSDYTALTEENVERVQCDRTFDTLAEVLSWMSDQGKTPIETGIINLYVAPLSANLGEAVLVGNYGVVHSGTVGGDLIAGYQTDYDLGITAVHEVGHMLGLPHPFNGNATCEQVFSDMPTVKYPNYGFKLVQSGGVWTGTLCNRDRDCKYYRNGDTSVLVSTPGITLPYSCFSCNETAPTCNSCDTELYEMAMNFMEYGTDLNIVAFSKQQATYKRQVLLSGEAGLTLHDSDGGAISEVDSADNGSGLSTWLIVGIVAGAIGAVIIIALAYYYYWRPSK